ncbi:NAD-dependent epimerase/dehydratase family protein [Promicromonospora kroppenstedtii]|uniref:NAD-dependent epimerase/dehydratase family protein n=1 Tax=Promicromonospora kroppenstedtii TaxID=440482 RepID=UPI000567829F|nr:NAD-dependent epimerase/dehydratase family protein [Promicromonospora kroppenstedtii]
MTGPVLPETAPSEKPVLVTGGTGYVGGHLVATLLERGYRVRATVRDAGRADAVGHLVRAAGVDPGDRLETVVTSLDVDAGWAEALAGVSVVHHVASPFLSVPPERADEVIVPAVEGTLRVLRHARDAGAAQVVLTSSFAAVGYGPPTARPDERPYDERDWTDLDHPDDPYIRSKVLAERAAWDFVAEQDTGPRTPLGLTVLNPTGIFGPVLGGRLSTSVGAVGAMLTGDLAALPRMRFGVVDVRDVAEAHVRAMTTPAAVGERILLTSGDVVTWGWVIELLRRELGVEIATVEQPAAGGLPPLAISNDKARRLLGMSFVPARTTLLDTARGLAPEL